MFQDEKDFSLQVPTNRQNNRVYFNGPKKDVQQECLYSKGNKFLKKGYGICFDNLERFSQPFFIGGNGIKVNGASYLKHLRDDFIPAVEATLLNKGFTFAQDSAPSHCANQVQNFLKQKLKSKFVKNTDWPPKLPDWNPLDYYFWNRVREKVYDGRYCYPLATIDELKRRICNVWDECERICSLTEKENLKSFFDIKNFIFRGYSYQPHPTDLSITFSVLHL